MCVGLSFPLNLYTLNHLQSFWVDKMVIFFRLVQFPYHIKLIVFELHFMYEYEYIVYIIIIPWHSSCARTRIEFSSKYTQFDDGLCWLCVALIKLISRLMEVDERQGWHIQINKRNWNGETECQGVENRRKKRVNEWEQVKKRYGFD